MTDEEIIKDDIAVLLEERQRYIQRLLTLFRKMRECQAEINRHMDEARQKGIEV